MIEIEVRALQFDWNKCARCEERILGGRTCDCVRKFPPPGIRHGHAYAIQTDRGQRHSRPYENRTQHIFLWESRTFPRADFTSP